MQLADCPCDDCERATPLGWITEAATYIITDIVGGALSRAANARAKKRAWREALQRIPADDYVDYAQYVRDNKDFYDAWKSGSWLPARGATLPEFGYIHMREFGPRTGARITALPPGPRPDPGPTNGFGASFPVSVLHEMPPLANPVPKVRGVNDMLTPKEQRQRDAQRARALRQRDARRAARGQDVDENGDPLEVAANVSSISTPVLLIGGALFWYFFLNDKRDYSDAEE